MKRFTGMLVICMILMLAGLPVYAEVNGNTDSQAPEQKTVQKADQAPVQDTGTAPSEEKGHAGGTGKGGLDVSPVDTGKVVSGFSKMGDDLRTLGQSISYPLFIFGLVLGMTMIVFGAVLSKKLMHAGLIACVASFITLLMLGDIQHVTNLFASIAKTIRSYF